MAQLTKEFLEFLSKETIEASQPDIDSHPQFLAGFREGVEAFLSSVLHVLELPDHE